LPQWLEIVTRAPANEGQSSKRIELMRPRLLINGADLPVEISLWSCRAPGHAGQPQTSGADVVDAVDQAALRLARLVSIVESTATTALELPPDGYRWYRPWAARLVALGREASATPGTRQSAQISSTAEEQLAAASERLDAWIAQCDAKFEKPEDSDSLADSRSSADFMLASSSANDTWVHCVAEGGQPRLTIEFASASFTPEQTCGIGLLSIVGAAAAAIGLVRHPAMWDVVCRWPHALVTAAGIAYWAWLWPSWFGLVVALMGVATSLLPSITSRTIPGEGSTVLRSGRSA
jgi:hypothetical protein